MSAVTRETIEDFLSQRKLALVGASRGGEKVGNAVHKVLRSRGYAVYLVHPTADTIDGERCWPRLKDLPEPVGGVVTVVPPVQTEKVVQAAADAGIARAWMQEGSESAKAIAFCEANGIAVVYGRCIMRTLGSEFAGIKPH